MTETKDIIVEFSGWVRIEPDKVNFELIRDSDRPWSITGTEWVALDEDAKADYTLEDLTAVQRDAHDGETLDLSVFEDDSTLQVLAKPEILSAQETISEVVAFYSKPRQN